MKVFITGATGFIGRSVVERLIREGWDVTALVRRTISNERREFKKIKIVYGDIRDSSWTSEVREKNIFIHLAGIHGFVDMPESERVSIEVDGSRNVISACKKYKVPLIYTSTAYVSMRTTYARVKSLAKKEVVKTISEGLKGVILSPVAVYGRGNDRNFSRVFSLLNKGYFFFVGTGNTKWHLVYIDDLIVALMLIIKNLKKLYGKNLVVSGPKPISLIKIVEIFEKLTGKKVTRFYVPEFVMRFMGLAFSILESYGLGTPFNFDNVVTMTTDQYFPTSVELTSLGFEAKVDMERGMALTLFSKQ